MFLNVKPLDDESLRGHRHKYTPSYQVVTVIIALVVTLSTSNALLMHQNEEKTLNGSMMNKSVLDNIYIYLLTSSLKHKCYVLRNVFMLVSCGNIFQEKNAVKMACGITINPNYYYYYYLNIVKYISQVFFLNIINYFYFFLDHIDILKPEITLPCHAVDIFSCFMFFFFF